MALDCTLVSGKRLDGMSTDLTPMSCEELALRLQGIGVGVLVESQEPYEWLVDNWLVNCDEVSRESNADILAHLAADLLRDYVNTRWADRGIVSPKCVLLNLAYLCGELRRPAILWEPLLALFKSPPQDEQFGACHGHSIALAVRAALIENQYGPDLRNDWLQILNGKEHPRLGRRIIDATYGVLKMPAVRGDNSRPWMDAIGEAFLLVARDVERSKTPRTELCARLRRARDTWPRYDSWDKELFSAAIAHKWPAWAVSCLPKTSWSVSGATPHEWIVWDAVVEWLDKMDLGYRALSDSAYETAGLRRITATKDADLFLRCFCPLIDHFRVNADKQDAESLRVVILYLFQRVAEQIASGESIQKAVERYLGELHGLNKSNSRVDTAPVAEDVNTVSVIRQALFADVTQ